MSIRNRIEALERAQANWRRRTVVIGPSEHPSEVPGAIEPAGDGRHWRLYVAEEHGLDPVAGLSGEQREFLRGDDLVIVMKFAVMGDGSYATGLPESPDFPTWERVCEERGEGWRI